MFGCFGEVSDELRQGALNNVKIAIENFKAVSLKEAEVRGKLDVLFLKYKNLAAQWNSVIDKAYYQSSIILAGQSQQSLLAARQAIQGFKISAVMTNSIPASSQDILAVVQRVKSYSTQNYDVLLGTWTRLPWLLEKALSVGRQAFLENTTPGVDFRQVYPDFDHPEIMNSVYDALEVIKNDIGSLPSSLKSLLDQMIPLLLTYSDVYSMNYQVKETLRQAIIDSKQIIADLPSIDEIENRIKQNLDPVTGQPLTPPPSEPPSPPVKVPDVVAIQEKPALVVAQEQPKSKLPAIAAAAAAAFYFLGGNK